MTRFPHAQDWAILNQHMQTLIALDLETTGLDPIRDAVIEIGTVRFRDNRVEDEWTTLVNPGRPLPGFITQLTGITDDMLADAPRLSQVLGELESRAGDLPILGHSVRFDLAFLRRKGLFDLNQTVDTFDLASVLLPSASRYRLGALASALGVPVRSSHRALDDARTTMQVYLKLVAQARKLPLAVVEEIVRLGAEIEWGGGWVFEETLRARLRNEGASALGPKKQPVAFERPSGEVEPLKPAQEIQSLNSEDLAAVLEPGGPLAKRFSEYEHRPQQVTMLRAVADALSSGHHLLVEAGTGTGKSMAYLVPAFAWAAQNGQRVVISTNTINLQDQLIHKDIPDLCRILETDYQAAVLKGRGNYLCPRRLAALRRLAPRTPEEIRLLAKVLVWLEAGGSGDRGEINLPGPGELAVWSRLSAESEDCSGDACLVHTGGACPYYKSRQAAEAAHVVIVNHALLLADIATGNRVIPDYRYLIVDEAHHLEDAVTNGLSFHVTQADTDRLLRDLGGPGGLLTSVLGTARSQLSPETSAQVAKGVTLATDWVNDGSQLTQRFFDAISAFLTRARDEKELGPYGQQVRIVPATRTLPDWGAIEAAWEDLRQPLSKIVTTLDELAEALAGVGESGEGAAEDLALTLRSASRDLQEIFTNLENMVFEPEAQTIYWAEASIFQGRVSLHAAPLEVGPLVERFLWREKDSVIMTSATLTTAGEFDYIRRRLRADDADELALGSPFDYESSTLLFLVNDIPEPNERQEYQYAVERGLLRLCKATRGRTLALFTSYDQLRRTSKAISDPLAAEGILVFEQGEGASPHSLLESFRTTEQAVLLGTRSFWEGVDVPGEALSVLAIIRLPFDVPSDPIVAARSETYESPFAEYSLPEAILRFRQGFGRLIRTRSDRGVVATFDRRILSKQYGRAFVDSLPQCTVKVGPLADLPSAAARWLGA